MDEEAIFLQAVEIEDPEAQAVFLDEACGTDDALRERLEELLAVRGRAENFMDEPAVTNVDTVQGADQLERCGTRNGPYLLMELIAEGGMGSVYRAEQQTPIRRSVALKIIKPGMDTKQVIGRFEAERQALALMDHAYIAQVLDAGSTTSGSTLFRHGPGRWCSHHELL